MRARHSEIGWFNPSRISASKDLSELIGAAWKLLPRQRDRSEPRRQIDAVISNLVRAHVLGFDCVHIRMGNGWYAKHSAYRHPAVETGKFPKLVRELSDHNIIELQRGVVGQGVSRMRPGSWLQDRMRSVQFSVQDFCLDHKEPVIILGKKESRDWSDPNHEPKTKRVEFAWTEQKRVMADRVHRLNEWFDTFQFAFEYCPKGPLYRTDLDNRVYRRFTETFENHGRLYGAWWINFPRDRRWQILLESADRADRLVQLDLSASFASIIYALEGKQPPLEPYEIPSVEAHYRKEGYLDDEAKHLARKAVKAVVTRRLSDHGQRNAYWHDKAGEEPFAWPKRALTCRQLIDIVCDHLPVVAPYIRADRDAPPLGPIICKQESDIIILALEKCRAQNIPALPIHDALLVKRGDYRQAGLLIAEAFREVTGAWPTIKATDIFSPTETAFLDASNQKPLAEILRSSDGLSQPHWPKRFMDTLVSHTLERSQLRGPKPLLYRQAWRAWKMSRDQIRNEFLSAPAKPMVGEPLLDVLLRAMVASESKLRARGLREQEITRVLKRGLQASIMRLRKSWKLDGMEVGLKALDEALRTLGLRPEHQKLE